MNSAERHAITTPQIQKEPLVILVNERDEQVGVMPKMEAHQKGLLHRAFSVFIFNDRGELLLQRRADTKYHSGGLWTNTCCSHPRPGETVIEAAHARMLEEVGFDCELEERFSFIYQVPFENGLYEHEYDHVITGMYNNDPTLNPDEASEFAWVASHDLKKDVADHPERYTYWFLQCIDRVLDGQAAA